MRFRDFVEVKDHYLSVLKGGSPIVCVMRYAPNGDRVKGGKSYKKVDHSEAGRYLSEFYRDGLHYIPLEIVDRHYDAMKMLREVCERDECVKRVADFFKLEKMGVTGSRLVGLAKDDSDVDFVLYDECFDIGREMIRRGIERGILDEPDFEEVYRKRKVSLPYEVFEVHERRKFNKAVLNGVRFDILYVGGDVRLVRGKRVGKLTVRGRVVEAKPFDYPAVYRLNDCEILCYTHTFVGQAFVGELVEARGVLEVLNGNRILIVGSRRDVEDEYVVSLTLLEREGIWYDFERLK